MKTTMVCVIESYMRSPEKKKQPESSHTIQPQAKYMKMDYMTASHIIPWSSLGPWNLVPFLHPLVALSIPHIPFYDNSQTM